MSDSESSSGESAASYEKGLTLEKLMGLLQEILAEDPDAKTMPLYHVEFGCLRRLRFVEVCDEINGKKVKRYIVLE